MDPDHARKRRTRHVKIPLVVMGVQCLAIAVTIAEVKGFGWHPSDTTWGAIVLACGVFVAAWSLWRLRNPEWWRDPYWSAHRRLRGWAALPRVLPGEPRERLDGTVGLVAAVVFAAVGIGLLLHVLHSST